MSDIRNRFTLELPQELKDKLTKRKSGKSLSTVVRDCIAVAVELWEAAEKLGLSQPKPGQVTKWLLELQQQHLKPTVLTIAELVGSWDLQELSDDTGIAEKRLLALASGAKPHKAELELLQLGFQISLDELLQIYYRDFPDAELARTREINAKCFGSLIRENLEIFQSASIKVNNLEGIINGDKPAPAEVVKIASILRVDSTELFALYKKSYPQECDYSNGVNQHS
jgi:hypothetical protein